MTIASLEHPAPLLKMKTVMTWTPQRPGRADSVRRSSKCSFRDSLIGLDSGVLKNTLLSKGGSR